MDFNEKLQELRKSRGLTQEELAEALYVSRTAISKWESGRGYPSIDSLKMISRFFSVKIDDLICSDEIISAAENEHRQFVSRYLALICGALDALTAVLLFIPAFGGGASSAETVPLFVVTGVRPWIKIVFAAIIVITVLNGICGMILTRFDKPLWNKHRLVTGMVLSMLGVAVFIMTRQPYAGILCFAFLAIKGILLLAAK